MAKEPTQFLTEKEAAEKAEQTFTGKLLNAVGAAAEATGRVAKLPGEGLDWIGKNEWNEANLEKGDKIGKAAGYIMGGGWRALGTIGELPGLAIEKVGTFTRRIGNSLTKPIPQAIPADSAVGKENARRAEAQTPASSPSSAR